MMRKFVLLALALNLPLAAAALRADQATLEVALTSIVLPTANGSALIATPCPGCVPRSFPTAAGLAPLLDGRPVALADLKRLQLAQKRIAVTLIFRKDSGQLLRLIANSL
jgi:hypothetical protein